MVYHRRLRPLRKQSPHTPLTALLGADTFARPRLWKCRSRPTRGAMAKRARALQAAAVRFRLRLRRPRPCARPFAPAALGVPWKDELMIIAQQTAPTEEGRSTPFFASSAGQPGAPLSRGVGRRPSLGSEREPTALEGGSWLRGPRRGRRTDCRRSSAAASQVGTFLTRSRRPGRIARAIRYGSVRFCFDLLPAATSEQCSYTGCHDYNAVRLRCGMDSSHVDMASRKADSACLDAEEERGQYVVVWAGRRLGQWRHLDLIQKTGEAGWRCTLSDCSFAGVVGSVSELSGCSSYSGAVLVEIVVVITATSSSASLAQPFLPLFSVSQYPK